MDDSERLYKMKLHDWIEISNWYFVLRVPGGWVYIASGTNEATSCFVPFDNEFQPKN